MNRAIVTGVGVVAVVVGLVACDELVYPIHTEFTVDIPHITEEDVEENENGWYELVKATPSQDVAAFIGQLPNGIQTIADVELVEVTLHSPEMGNLGEWVYSLSLYVSDDEVFDENDRLVYSVDALDDEVADYVMTLPEGLSLLDLAQSGSLSLIIRAELHTLPPGPLTMGMDLYAEGSVGF